MIQGYLDQLAKQFGAKPPSLEFIKHQERNRRFLRLRRLIEPSNSHYLVMTTLRLYAKGDKDDLVLGISKADPRKARMRGSDRQAQRFEISHIKHCVLRALGET